MELTNYKNLEVARTISIVTCAFNEEKTIGKVIDAVLRLNFVTEYVIIDNGSTDASPEIIREHSKSDPRVKILTLQENQGLGAGLIRGIRATTGEIVVRQDADLEYDPNEIFELIYPLLSGFAQVSFGSRLLVRRTHRATYFYNYLANVIITFFSNLFTNINLTDVETAAKAFEGPLVRELDLKSKGFEIEIEMLFKLKMAGAIFYEVPISYYGRTLEEGKKIRWTDGVQAILSILKYGILIHSPFKSFLSAVFRRGSQNIKRAYTRPLEAFPGDIS